MVFFLRSLTHRYSAARRSYSVSKGDNKKCTSACNTSYARMVFPHSYVLCGQCIHRFASVSGANYVSVRISV